MECSGTVLKKRKNKRGKELNELLLVSENLAVLNGRRNYYVLSCMKTLLLVNVYFQTFHALCFKKLSSFQIKKFSLLNYFLLKYFLSVNNKIAKGFKFS